MKRILISILLLLLLVFSFLPTGLLAQGTEDVVSANNQFAFDLYARYRTKGGNIFFSPYSISTALAMVYEGARGPTREEMQKVLHYPEDDSLVREGFQSLYNRINQENENYHFRIVNALWAQKDFKFLDDYLGIIEKYYSGKVRNLDFVAQPGPSRLIINAWVEEQTSNKIKDLVPVGKIKKSTRLIITNAIYFRCKWVRWFDEKNTKEKDFHLSNGAIVKSPVMQQMGTFDCFETDELQVLELLYDYDPQIHRHRISMLILLPKDYALGALERSLTAEKLDMLKRGLRPAKVDVSLPKFKLEAKFFMAEDLETMGISSAFSDEQGEGGYYTKADFSGITGVKNLNIDQLIHQAYIDVNEKGTEVAAATMGFMDIPAYEPSGALKIFNADHPFIFIIQDRETANILFMGRVMDPR